MLEEGGCRDTKDILSTCFPRRFGDNPLLCKQTACRGAHASSGFIIQSKHGQLSVYTGY